MCIISNKQFSCQLLFLTDILINNAGILRDKSVLKTTIEDWGECVLSSEKESSVKKKTSYAAVDFSLFPLLVKPVSNLMKKNIF